MESPYDTTTTGDLAAADDASVIDLDGQEPDGDADYDRDPDDDVTDPHARLDSDLFDPVELARYQYRWQQVQAAFVDDPRGAVRDADQLVDEVLDTLAARLSGRKGRLVGEWDHDGAGETEAMRQSFRRYRGFFQRLLSA